MFRKLALFIVCVSMISIAGCTTSKSKPYPHEDKSYVKEDLDDVNMSDDKTESDSLEKEQSEKETESSISDVDFSLTESATHIDSKSSEQNLISEGQVLYSQNGIEITTIKLEDKMEYDEHNLILSVEIVNNRDESITIDLNGGVMLLNDSITVPCMCYDTIMPGKKAISRLEIDADYFMNYGIKNIGKLKFRIVAYNESDYMELFTTDYIEVTTSLLEKMETEIQLDGTLDLYDTDGIRIKGKYVNHFGTYKGKGILMTVDNASGQDITLECNSVAVNGTMLSYGMVYPYAILSKTQAIAYLELDDGEEQFGDINEISFSFEIRDLEYYDFIAKTDTITLSKAS